MKYVAASAPIALIAALLAMAVLPLGGCEREHPEPSAATAAELARDHFSFANTDQFRIRHLELDLGVDFDRQLLEGTVILHLQGAATEARTVVLDSRGLQGVRARLSPADGQAVELDVRQGESDPVRGQALEIRLPPGFDPLTEFRLEIDYRTGPDASAIMWLPPELTAGGEQPFMFTQSQSIHARSWVPLQDSPLVRFTYEATIRTPPGLRALMSADNDPQAATDGVHRFRMPQPVPSYLLALAVGDLEFAAFGEDSGVYAEPAVLAAAAWEFADTQAMLDAAAATWGPYRWGRYDLLVLPPSFPYGGMENPRLSFITPSLLAGDRSLVSTIAHELAHSWSGNLVSNRTWRDIWLNEGTTTYLEARLMEIIYGKERADEERLLTWLDLREKLQTVPAAMQPLAPEFKTGDPDEGQGGLEYAKGQMLLEHLEQRFGRETFDRFMADYFDHFAFQAISSEQFLDYIDLHLLRRHPGIFGRAQLEEWLYASGLPADATAPVSSNLAGAAASAGAWARGELPVDKLSTSGWSPQATVYFIKALPANLAPGQLAELDRALGLSTSRNAEIARAWFIEVAKRRHLPAYAALPDYLGRYGRTRLVEPVYAALVANGEDVDLAAELFDSARGAYHPLTVAAIAKHLGGGAGK